MSQFEFALNPNTPWALGPWEMLAQGAGLPQAKQSLGLSHPETLDRDTHNRHSTPKP